MAWKQMNVGEEKQAQNQGYLKMVGNVHMIQGATCSALLSMDSYEGHFVL